GEGGSPHHLRVYSAGTANCAGAAATPVRTSCTSTVQVIVCSSPPAALVRIVVTSLSGKPFAFAAATDSSTLSIAGTPVRVAWPRAMLAAASGSLSVRHASPCIETWLLIFC